MNEILDHEDNKKPTKSRKYKVVIYLIVMLIGGILVIENTSLNGDKASYWVLIQASFLIELTVIGVSFILKNISLILKKKKKQEKELFSLGFWFKYIEDGFVIWLIFMALVYLGRF